jgi:GNAT superfamily N-acetyltransferase
MKKVFLGSSPVHYTHLPGGGADYTHPPGGGTGAITVNVTYHYRPFNLAAPHSIRYEGLGEAAATHRGYLDYTFKGNILSIHTMQAAPEGARLGSLLIYECTNRAASHCADRIRALNVAATARAFYLKCGFHPSSAGRDLAERVVPTPVFGQNCAVRLRLARDIGNWDGDRQQIQALAFGQINGYWI